MQHSSGRAQFSTPDSRIAGGFGPGADTRVWGRLTWVGWGLLALSVMPFACDDSAELQSRPNPAGGSAGAQAFSRLAVWDDGLAELCYYDASETIYGRTRNYTRVMLVNREWLNSEQMVKSESKSTQDLPVFKTNLIEEIPTENYNYRYMATVFLGRPELRFEKLSASSQEWCGTTFQRAVRRGTGIDVESFSYFEGEADRHATLPADSDLYPLAAMFLLAREVSSTGVSKPVRVLPKMRSTHGIAPEPSVGLLSREEAARQVRTSLGAIHCRRVMLSNGAGEKVASYDIEAAAPYRVVAHEHVDGLRLVLRYSERRAYWDRKQASRFYEQGQAP